jgi:hypothetical protein
MEKTNLQETKQEKRRFNLDPINQNPKDKVKAFTLENTHMPFDPNELFKKIEEEYIPESRKNNNIVSKKLRKAMTKLFMAYGLDTHTSIVRAVNDEYRPLALQLSREFNKEFNCQNPSEKALADLIVSSYIRMIEFSDKISRVYGEEAISMTKVGYYNFCSKEIDRAQRQFITALTTLKQIKSPALNINIKADTAFLADKQLNINNTKNEINKPK